MLSVDPQVIQDLSAHAAELPRQTPLTLTRIEEQWVGNDPQRAKMLLAFVAHELVGVPLHLIGLGLDGHTKGHVSRLVGQARMELRAALAEDEKSRGGSIPERPAA